MSVKFKMNELVQVGYNFQGADLETLLITNNVLLDTTPILYTYFDVEQSRKPKDFNFLLHNYAAADVQSQNLFKEYCDLTSNTTKHINKWKNLLVEQICFHEAFSQILDSDEEFKRNLQKIDADKNIEVK